MAVLRYRAIFGADDVPHVHVVEAASDAELQHCPEATRELGVGAGWIEWRRRAAPR